MVRAADFPVRNAEDLSEQRGWAPKALRLTLHTTTAVINQPNRGYRRRGPTERSSNTTASAA
jgi:hypothetical protein